MVGNRLSHSPRSVADNFYQNSFRQLTSVQQKQTGLLLGAAVADAAARSLDGYSEEEIASYEREQQTNPRRDGISGTSNDTATTTTPSFSSSSSSSSVVVGSTEAALQREREEALLFTSVPLRGAVALSPSTGAQYQQTRRVNPLTQHSFSYQLYYHLLRAMTRARGEFPLSEVEGSWVEAASMVHHDTFGSEHGTLLHTLCTLLPMPTIYPYASDDALRAYVQPFARFLTEPPSLVFTDAAQSVTATAATPTAMGAPSSSKDIPTGCVMNVETPVAARTSTAFTAAELVDAERALVSDFTMTVLGVALRYLQSNPDPVRNGAFRAVPGCCAVFPPDVATFCPPASSSHAENRGIATARQHEICTAAWPCFPKNYPLRGTHSVPPRPALRDAQTVQEGLSIARSARSYAAGVSEAVRRGGPTCQRAMVVGALLGARFGVRAIPLRWLSATPDHKPLSTMAIEVAQWTWNPPHH